MTCHGANNYQGAGIYRHYKGNSYLVLGLGIHEHAIDHQPKFDLENPEQYYVVYTPLYPGHLLEDTPGDFFFRNLVNFNDFVRVSDVENGITCSRMVRRFEKVADQSEELSEPDEPASVDSV